MTIPDRLPNRAPTLTESNATTAEPAGSQLRHQPSGRLSGFAVALAEAVAPAVAAVVAGSGAMLAQTATSVADVGVELVLPIGAAQNARSPDSRHPLGYGRERFFWSLFAAIGSSSGEEESRPPHAANVGSSARDHGPLPASLTLGGTSTFSVDMQPGWKRR